MRDRTQDHRGLLPIEDGLEHWHECELQHLAGNPQDCRSYPVTIDGDRSRPGVGLIASADNDWRTACVTLDSGGEAVMSPEDARRLAGLLLEHADRAQLHNAPM